MHKTNTETSLKISGKKERENTWNVVRHPFTVDKPKTYKRIEKKSEKEGEKK
jgi:hypothetical protein